MSADTTLDAEKILQTLSEHDVEYVLIGGMAVQTHGHIRTTVDIDLIPKPERSNLQRLADALNSLEARVLNPDHEGEPIDATMLPRATLWQLSSKHGAIDVLHDAPGAPPYNVLREQALQIKLGKMEIAVAGLDDLISMKRARGRPQDLDDIAALTQEERKDR